MSETTEPKVMHEWTLAGYHSRIVETQPGIVTSEQAMDDDKLGRLWLPKVAPMGWQNEMIQLAAEVARLSALVPRWVEARESDQFDLDVRLIEVRRVNGKTFVLEVPIPPLPGTETP